MRPEVRTGGLLDDSDWLSASAGSPRAGAASAPRGVPSTGPAAAAAAFHHTDLPDHTHQPQLTTPVGYHSHGSSLSSMQSGALRSLDGLPARQSVVGTSGGLSSPRHLSGVALHGPQHADTVTTMRAGFDHLTLHRPPTPIQDSEQQDVGIALRHLSPNRRRASRFASPSVADAEHHQATMVSVGLGLGPSSSSHDVSSHHTPRSSLGGSAHGTAHREPTHSGLIQRSGLSASNLHAALDDPLQMLHRSMLPARSHGEVTLTNEQVRHSNPSALGLWPGSRSPTGSMHGAGSGPASWNGPSGSPAGVSPNRYPHGGDPGLAPHSRHHNPVALGHTRMGQAAEQDSLSAFMAGVAKPQGKGAL